MFFCVCGSECVFVFVKEGVIVCGRIVFIVEIIWKGWFRVLLWFGIVNYVYCVRVISCDDCIVDFVFFFVLEEEDDEGDESDGCDCFGCYFGCCVGG